MNEQQDNLRSELGRALHEQADGIGGTPISLEQVKGTAGRIRRRRAIAASAAAAAAVAIIVPTVMMSTNLGGDAGEDNTPPPATQTTEQQPRLEHGGSLDVADLPQGEAPRVVWIENGTTLHVAEGETVELPRAFDSAVPYDDGWLGLYSDGGETFGQLLDGDGQPLGASFASGRAAASSADGSRVLYLSDGELVVHDNESGSTDTIREGATAASVLPVGFAGDSVVYNVQLPDGSMDGRLFRDGEERDPRSSGLFFYTSVTEQGWLTAVDEIEEIPEAHSCSVVIAPHGNQAGRTCEVTLDALSPDGRHVLAGPTYRSGYGDGVLAVVASDGADVGSGPVHLIQTGQRDATLMGSTWEDADHVLVVTSTPVPGSTSVTWQLLRIGLDGTVENAAQPVATETAEPQVAPFGLF